MSMVTPREPQTPRREGARRERATVSRKAVLDDARGRNSSSRSRRVAAGATP